MDFSSQNSERIGYFPQGSSFERCHIADRMGDIFCNLKWDEVVSKYTIATGRPWWPVSELNKYHLIICFSTTQVGMYIDIKVSAHY